jgi:anti-anti-sigma factor
VTVDLAGLEFCDSSGLATFLRFHREAERAGSTLVLRSPQPNVRRMFELTGTDAMLPDGQPASAAAGSGTAARG